MDKDGRNLARLLELVGRFREGKILHAILNIHAFQPVSDEVRMFRTAAGYSPELERENYYMQF